MDIPTTSISAKSYGPFRTRFSTVFILAETGVGTPVLLPTEIVPTSGVRFSEPIVSVLLLLGFSAWAGGF